MIEFFESEATTESRDGGALDQIIGRMLGFWKIGYGTWVEAVDRRGDWNAVRPIYGGALPTFAPFE